MIKLCDSNETKSHLRMMEEFVFSIFHTKYKAVTYIPGICSQVSVCRKNVFVVFEYSLCKTKTKSIKLK